MKSDRSFASILKDLAEGSSLHGIPKTVSSKQKPVKILWCLLFIATGCVFGLQLYNLFSAYYSWPVQTAVSLKFSPLQFPAVTFCNMNPVKLTHVKKYPDLQEVINPKVKRTTPQNRRKREAPISSTIPYTSTLIASDAVSSTSTSMFTSNPVDYTVTVSSAQTEPTSMTASPSVTSDYSSTTSALDMSTSYEISPSSVVSADYNEGSSGSSDGSSGDYDGSGGSSGYYYDYWGNWWDDWYSSYDYNDSYYSEYGSGSGYSSSGSFGNYYDGFSDHNDIDYGINSYLYDQLHSPKDQWDERILKFQVKFKNETQRSREDMGHLVSDMVVSASFASSLQNVSKFERVTTTEYGNCYTMTSPKYIAMRSGPAHGIKLTLNLEMDEYIKNFASGYGIRMVFHEPGTFPLPAEEGMTLSPGYETSIGLRMVRVGRLGPPHGHCSDGLAFSNRYNIRYSVTACMQFCRIRRTIDTCKCIPSDAPDLNVTDKQVDICFSNRNKQCQLAVDLSFDDGSAVEECDCISPCNEMVYTKTMSGRRWPNDDYLKNVLMKDICSKNISSMSAGCQAINNNTFDAEIYRYNFLRVLIYFEDLNYESIMQEPLYEGVRFLSDIGGAMGLFMGASLLSFVEVLQLLLEIVLYVFRAKIPRNEVKTMSQHEKRKDSIFPAQDKLHTTFYEEPLKMALPHAVEKSY